MDFSHTPNLQKYGEELYQQIASGTVCPADPFWLLDRRINEINEILKNTYNDAIKHRKISLVKKHHYIPITKI